ncbi:MAG: oxidoreductase, partial [Paenisporosarcina sp.]|nr:oxidoreductase [Paenisporosarcina sp.]
RKALSYEHPKLDVLVKDFDTIEEKDIEVVHDFFCCLGTTIKTAGSKEVFEKVDLTYPVQLACMAKNRGVSHFLVISAMGANPNSSVYYNRVKGEMEKQLIELNLKKLSIFRPSLLTGDRKEFRLGERIGGKVMQVVNPILIGPLKKYRSIASQQVAFAMMQKALTRKATSVNIYRSDEIAAVKAFVPKVEAPIPREKLFNWEKHEDLFVEDDLKMEPVDRPFKKEE